VDSLRGQLLIAGPALLDQNFGGPRARCAHSPRARSGSCSTALADEHWRRAGAVGDAASTRRALWIGGPSWRRASCCCRLRRPRRVAAIEGDLGLARRRDDRGPSARTRRLRASSATRLGPASSTPSSARRLDRRALSAGDPFARTPRICGAAMLSLGAPTRWARMPADPSMILTAVASCGGRRRCRARRRVGDARQGPSPRSTCSRRRIPHAWIQHMADLPARHPRRFTGTMQPAGRDCRRSSRWSSSAGVSRAGDRDPRQSARPTGSAADRCSAPPLGARAATRRASTTSTRASPPPDRTSEHRRAAAWANKLAGITRLSTRAARGSGARRCLRVLAGRRSARSSWSARPTTRSPTGAR